jgi:hypothetical protein
VALSGHTACPLQLTSAPSLTICCSQAPGSTCTHHAARTVQKKFGAPAACCGWQWRRVMSTRLCCPDRMPCTTPTHIVRPGPSYMLLKVVGALVQGPRKPLRSVWQRPSVCAPDSATMSCTRGWTRVGQQRHRLHA